MESATIYLDLVNALSDKGHSVFVLALTSSGEKAGKTETKDNISVAYEFIPDQFHAGKIKKGLIQLMIGRAILKGVKRNFWKEDVDIIIYPTPPVTLAGIISPLKTHFNAVAYLMLKDIFPQNAVDLHMMGKDSALRKLFTAMERKLYRDSDIIGCMSGANLRYIQRREPWIRSSRLEIFPNTVKILGAEELAEMAGDGKTGNAGVSTASGVSTVSVASGSAGNSGEGPVRFIFGGNLGIPQGVDFLMEGISRLKDYEDAEFIFIGSGTEEKKIEQRIKNENITNLTLLKELPRREYEKLLSSADVGIVSLSPAFTIPNYPSRILSYMQLSKPVFAVTDRNTDIRELVTQEARCGWWCPSDDLDAFTDTVKKIVFERDSLKKTGKRGRKYLKENFNVERSVEILERAAGAGKD